MIPDAMLPSPPPTVALKSEAVLSLPPPTVVYSSPDAVLVLPPPTTEKFPVANRTPTPGDHAPGC